MNIIPSTFPHPPCLSPLYLAHKDLLVSVLQLYQKILPHRCFLEIFAVFLRTLFLQSTSGRCLLQPGKVFKLKTLGTFTKRLRSCLYFTPNRVCLPIEESKTQAMISMNKCRNHSSY